MSTRRGKELPAPGAAIERALRAVIAALEASGHPAMIIGGIAVIARGVARLTKDIDATIAGGDADLDRVVEALSSHRIVPRIAHAVKFAQESHVLLLQRNSVLAAGAPTAAKTLFR